MSTDTPSESITALLAYSQADEEGIIVTVSRQAIHEVVRENARLREEVEMLNVRHAASMLHAQTHADEYNALREDEKGLLQDIQRLTEEAFKRDEELAIQSNANVGLMEELAEAKRELDDVKGPQFTKRIDIVTKTFRDRAEQAEARALAAGKDAGRYIDKWSHSCNALCMEIDLWIKNCPHCGKPAPDAAIGAKHD